MLFLCSNSSLAAEVMRGSSRCQCQPHTLSAPPPHAVRPSLPSQVLPVAVIFTAAQFLFTLSLANTSVTSNTLLSSSASMWTLLASALVLRERVTPVKLASVVAVMAGVLVWTWMCVFVCVVVVGGTERDAFPHSAKQAT